jgi:hypothetical protein
MAISYRVVADMSSGWHSHSIGAQVALGRPSAHFLLPKARVSLVHGSRPIFTREFAASRAKLLRLDSQYPPNRRSEPTVKLLTRESMLGWLPTLRWLVMPSRTTSIL